MPGLGISRVADITRMDRLGLPVFASVRPRGRALCVNAGKGVHPLEAKVGALMEAVEYAAAEPQRSAWVMRRLPVAEIARQFDDGLHWIDFAPVLGVTITPEQTVETVECEDLRTGKTVLLPAELVFVPYAPADGATMFGWTSNGLASGNSLEEATLHALLEVLERDAVSMNKARDASQWLDSQGFPEPLRSLASAWHGLGIELAVRHVPNGFALPCIEAVLHEPGSASINLAAGFGLHIDREIALARALCEAAQSRLSHIHGGRDDITNFYAKYAGANPVTRGEQEAGLIGRMFDPVRQIEFGALPHEPCEDRSLAGMLGALLQRMSGLGFGAVFRHRFGIDLHGLHVVKLIVPKCEHVQHHSRRIGPRLLSRIVGDA